MSSGINEGIFPVVKHYADAWAANDLKRIIDSYHDEVVFHYAGNILSRVLIAASPHAWRFSSR
jgi:ketosteroid isomerase-like protein